MENQPTKLDKAVKISILVGVSIVALSVGYYLVIFIPKKEAIKIEQQQQEKYAKKECAEYAKKEACSNDGTGGCNGDKYNFRLGKCLKEKGL